MNEIKNSNVCPDEKILVAHDFLLKFIGNFDKAERGGVHDYIEMSVSNMITAAIDSIDKYLSTGHKSVDATQVLHLVTDSYQSVIDNMKRNLDKIDKVNFK